MVDWNVKTSPIHDGVRKEFKFANGYGASIVRHSFSYGGNKGLWELAVLDKNGELCYDTPITDDVIGHLNDPEVDRILEEIKRLPDAN